MVIQPKLSNVSWLANSALPILVCVVFASAWHAYFFDLFPLSEARDWLGWGNSIDVWNQVISNLLLRTDRFARSFSMTYALATGHFCGSNVHCVNASLAAPQVLAALMYFLWLRRMFISRWPAVAIVALWSCSLPYLASASWQATIHDRLGLLALFTSFAVAWSWRPSWSTSTNVSYSLALLTLSFIALNCKEAFWFAPIALGLVHLFHALNWPDRRSRLWLTVTMAPSVAYFFWYFYRYLFAVNADQSWVQHTQSGDILANASAYLKALFGHSAVVIIAVIGTLELVRRQRHVWSAQHKHRLLWSASILLLALAPIARTKYAAEYYLLTPYAALLMLLGLCITSPPEMHRSVLRFSAIIPIAFVAGTVLALGSDQSAYYLQRRNLSSNFMNALNQDPQLISKVAHSKVLCIERPDTHPQTYLFTDSKFAWDILRWSAPTDELLKPRTETVVVTVTGEPSTCTPNLQLDNDLRR